MSSLRAELVEYLAVRRALGYKLDTAERLLGRFIDYLEARGEQRITIERALSWAILPGGHPGYHAHRLQTVRRFARYLHAADSEVEVPPAGLLTGRSQRATPYLYTDEQISALIAAAKMLGTAHRTATFQVLIGVLAVTGMRLGEAIGLDRDDLDSRYGVLTVHGKYGKARELPLHPTAVDAVCRYLRRRDRPPSPPDERALLVSEAGTRLLASNVQHTFGRMRARAGIAPRSAACRPRLHDVRHSFAVRTLLDAYRDEVDVGARLASLSTYLGHLEPSMTYWYLDAAPELMGLAAERLERSIGRAS
ncbi:MAG TPA: tyrosine-type recombinase/integrase [Solirubrobacterales bacterium]|nr:tyrosine-type recombinase/integrase [Solirubrobacterales bacterium]